MGNCRVGYESQKKRAFISVSNKRGVSLCMLESAEKATNKEMLYESTKTAVKKRLGVANDN